MGIQEGRLQIWQPGFAMTAGAPGVEPARRHAESKARLALMS
jgi:hypothetical protein